MKRRLSHVNEMNRHGRSLYTILWTVYQLPFQTCHTRFYLFYCTKYTQAETCSLGQLRTSIAYILGNYFLLLCPLWSSINHIWLVLKLHSHWTSAFVFASAIISFDALRHLILPFSNRCKSSCKRKCRFSLWTGCKHKTLVLNVNGSLPNPAANSGGIPPGIPPSPPPLPPRLEPGVGGLFR